MFAGTLALLAVVAVQAPEAARAESLLAAGALPQARAIAERLVARFPREPRYHILLGRIWFAWPVIGRYDALAQFRTAARLAPHDPEPLYRQIEVGFYLGSDEGEIMAREALIGIMRLDPDYRDVWARFQQLYRNEAIWRRADGALARHAEHPVALERRGQLAIALREPERADSIATLVLAHGGARVAAFVLRAEAAFLGDRDSAGQAWYDSALAYADQDSTGMLWDRAWTIANPGEAALYAATAPAERRSFLTRFWALRDPNLLTAFNERLGEHVRRTADARHRFRLRHPFRMVYRSRTARALAHFDRRRWLVDLASSTPRVVNAGLDDSASATMQVALLDQQALQDTAHEQAYRAGLDARGLMFVRHGAPDMRVACTPEPMVATPDSNCRSVFDGEGWLYWTADGPRTVSFRDAEYFAPVSARQLRSTLLLLGSDRSTVAAPLPVDAITAFFAGAEPGATDVYVRAPGGIAALVLWDVADKERARHVGRGVLRAAVRPGHYRVGLDVDSAGALGRLRTAVIVPDFAPDELLLSSLVLAPDSGHVDRVATIAAMPPNLRFAAGAPLAAYVELYGLTAVSGSVHYTARYTFAPARGLVGRLLRGSDPVSFEFERLAPAGVVVAERLVLEPGRVPPGRYRVTVAVTDLERNVKSETAELVVTLR